MGVALTDKTSRKKSLSTGLINYCRLMFMSQRLFTGTYEENIAMRKTLENCGFTINYFYDKGSKVYTGFVREENRQNGSAEYVEAYELGLLLCE